MNTAELKRTRHSQKEASKIWLLLNYCLSLTAKVSASTVQHQAPEGSSTVSVKIFIAVLNYSTQPAYFTNCHGINDDRRINRNLRKSFFDIYIYLTIASYIG
jgi:hypothetical protein